ncbi:MAG: hypothetical protein EBS89_04610 [Proteobacteria bacterium]|jgi:hypothetical protein|nr:hypothetical protein [Pseudomonadota bacterium]
MSTELRVALATENDLNDKFSYDEPKALLFSLNGVNDYGLGEVIKEHWHGDVYELLASPKARSVAKDSEFVAILTCGWASPITEDGDDEVAPSQHPQRRRVRLFIVASRKGVASVLRFRDDPENPITDDGQARGSLADAVQQLFARADAELN